MTDDWNRAAGSVVKGNRLPRGVTRDSPMKLPMKPLLITLWRLGLVVSLGGFATAASLTWKGQISDSTCAVSHQKVIAAHSSMTSRNCTLACVSNGGRYVLVSEGKVFKIANQDLPALQTNAGYAVQLTGEMKDDTITVSKIVPLEDHGRILAAPFSLPDSNGARVALANYKGKVVVLNFWATWCGPCKVEIPWFIEFNKTYKARGLAVLGVAMDEGGWKAVKPYMLEKKIDYPIGMGNEEVAKAYGEVDALPTTILIDRSGRIVFVHTGLVGKDTYENEIRSLLEGK